jgi:hypothetical protein
MKVYIVTEPDGTGRIYDTWKGCQDAVAGKRGLRYQSVSSREKAQEMLAGGRVLPPGSYAFTDGNAAAGVGIVLVEQGPDGSSSIQPIPTSVYEVFADGQVQGLQSAEAVSEALEKLGISRPRHGHSP